MPLFPRSLISLGLGLSAFLPASLWAQTLPDAAAVQRYAEQLLDAQRIDPKGPGLAVLVARSDTLLVQGARGMASIELGVPLRPEQVHRLGSVTKQFAAATLLRLIDEGQAALDDPLSKYLPDYPNGQAITLSQLLDHSSGIKSYTGIAGYMGNAVRADLTTQQLVAVFKDQKPDFAPGTAWAYNNSGYVLVGAVIESITKQPWHEALQQRLLAPAGLSGVLYPAPDRLVPGHVQGYGRGARGVSPAGLISMSQPHAAGALSGDLVSLWRWNQALHENGLLKPATYARMTTPQGAAQAPGYGFGLSTGKVRGMPMLHHGGGIHGFSTRLQYLPQQRITVALLRNSDAGDINLDQLGRQLAAFAAGKPFETIKPVPLPAASLPAFEGQFRMGPDSRLVRVIDGKLTSTRSGARPLALVPLGDDRFAFENSLAQLRFERGGDGKVVAVHLMPEGDPAEAQRWERSGDVPQQQEITLTEDQRSALLGRYANDRLDMRVFVDEQGRLRGQVAGQPVVTLKASGLRELFIVEVDAKLLFSPAEGPVKSATLLQGPARIELPKQ